MRHSKALTVAGSVRTRSFGLRSMVLLVVAGIVVVWVGAAFVQEAYLSHKLSQQVSDLRHQNAQIAAQNAGYQKDVQALTSGTADEEEARLNGYAKPNEKLYLVTTPPSPSPSPRASPSAKAK
ncbi:MAG TPA: septum formation initiator family protein [Candidatus Dormibacteraeota bacterium]